MNTLKVAVAILYVVAVTSLVGCAGSRSEPSMGTTIDDSMITSKVKTSLLSDDLVSGMDIGVETTRGVVQLSGFVDAENQIDRAIRLANDVEGVRAVQNKMSLKPAPEPERSSKKN